MLSAKVMRIRKKFLLFVFIVVFFVFIYFYLNSHVPNDKKDMFYVDAKIKKSDKIKTPRHQSSMDENSKADSLIDIHDNLIPPETKDLEKNDLINDQILPENSNDAELSCNFDADQIPKVDIQMLDAYKEIPFDNVDGGAWKQGMYIYRPEDSFRFNNY